MTAARVRIDVEVDLDAWALDPSVGLTPTDRAALVDALTDYARAKIRTAVDDAANVRRVDRWSARLIAARAKVAA